MNVEKLKDRMVKISDRCRRIQEAIDDDGRLATEKETSELSQLVDDFRGLEAQVALAEKVGDVANAMSAPMPRKTAPQPLVTMGNNYPARPGFAPRGASFGELFQRPAAGSQSGDVNGFSSIGEFCRTALLNPLDQRLQNRGHGVRNSMSEGIGEDGGFAVPVQFFGSLLDASLESEIIRPRCGVIPMSSNMATLPSFNYLDSTGNTRAGLVLRWVNELATNTNQNAKMTPMNMRANKAAIFVSASSEVTEDVEAFSRRLEIALMNATAAGLDYVFVFGNGAGQPLGVMNSPALITVSKESAQAANTINEDNIVKMAARLHPSCWANAVWIASPTCLAQLYKLSQATGPNAGGRSTLLREGDGGLTLMTKPLLISDACAPLSTTGDLILADFSKYLVGLRREATVQTSIHSGWFTDETGFKMTLRLDGQPEWAQPIKLRDGTNTVSSFVALESR
jgi:HK97 family phage major capsid protein